MANYNNSLILYNGYSHDFMAYTTAQVGMLLGMGWRSEAGVKLRISSGIYPEYLHDLYQVQ